MNILVIGNGFDLAHGMKTKYEHFLTYVSVCKQYYDIFSGENKIGEIWKNETDQFEKDCIKSIGSLFDEQRVYAEEFYDLVKDNHWINYFIAIYQDRIAHGKDGWIDFEKEILEEIRILDNARKEVSKQIELNGSEHEPMTKAQNKQLSLLLGLNSGNSFSMEYFQNIKNQLTADLKNLTRALEIYLAYFAVNTGKQECISMIQGLNIDKVLSFNYTNTYEDLYDEKKLIEYDYIHGKAQLNSNDSCNLVVGINEYLEGDEKNHDNYFIEFKKFFQRIFKKTGSKYSIWIKQYIEDCRITKKYDDSSALNVYFYGHSLDVTDKDILKQLIMTDGAKTRIYYYSQKALNNQIANLVEIIGEEQLIRKTDAANAEIEFECCAVNNNPAY